MTPFEMPEMPSIAEQTQRLRDGRRDLRAELGRLRERLQAHAALNAFAHVDWDRAGTAIERLAAATGTGDLPLAGVFVSMKDLYNVDGMPTRGGTRAPLPALGGQSVVATRLEQAGAILFGKTNMHEIALGATGENAWTGDVCNPHAPARQAGGSSSGAGVAVACGIGAAGIGSDTGGSIRIPAAFCGVVGFKPTFGAIPLDGALPLSWTCDHAGPLTRSVADAAILYEVLARRSSAHGRVARRPRLGLPKAWLAGRLAPAVRQRFDAIVAALAPQADLVDAPIATIGLAWQHYTPIVRAEAAHVHRVALASAPEGFSEPVLGPLKAGMPITASQYFESMQARATFIADIDAVLAGVDALILPTSAILPPLRGQLEADTEGGRMTVREAVLGQTLPFSFAGVPALSLPAGRVDGLPIGLQVVARRDGDATLLALGVWLEAQLGRLA